MATALEPNKTKIAKRVIEIFEFFSETSREATVMDIVRRYGRPQSSTSELLASLAEMGLLYKNLRSRSYSPTPRLAALGSSVQPEIIRGGGLFAFMDRLAGTTQCSVALFGMVGTYVQIFRLSAKSEGLAREISYGASESLSASVAGLLLLSTQPPDLAGRILWRLNGEAPANAKFDFGELREQVAAFRKKSCGVGKAGFVPGSQMAATLLPRSVGQRPLALGVFYPEGAPVDTEELIAMMKRGIASCANRHDEEIRLPVAEVYQMAM